MSEIGDMLEAARRGTLAHDDQRLQRLRRQAGQGSQTAKQQLEEIAEAGGAHRGSVNKVI